MGSGSGWSFVRSASGNWMWKHAPPYRESISTHSSRTFTTLAECIADAKLHGYSDAPTPDVNPGGTLFDERRNRQSFATPVDIALWTAVQPGGRKA